jgi:hypothetical protein
MVNQMNLFLNEEEIDRNDCIHIPNDDIDDIYEIYHLFLSLPIDEAVNRIHLLQNDLVNQFLNGLIQYIIFLIEENNTLQEQLKEELEILFANDCNSEAYQHLTPEKIEQHENNFINSLDEIDLEFNERISNLNYYLEHIHIFRNK